MEKQPTFTVIGDVSIDLVMGPVDNWPSIGTETIVEHTEMRAGGSAGNSALAAHYLGQPCRLLSMVGNDEFGVWLNEQFKDICPSLPSCEAPTSLSVGVIHDCGERTFLTSKGHLEALELPNIREELASQAIPGSIALLSGVFLTPRVRIRYGELIGCLKNRGYKVAIDTGWPPSGWTDDLRQEVMSWLQECDYVLLNETEVVHLSDDPDFQSATLKLAQTLKTDTCLVAKTGPEGALAISGNQEAHCKALQTKVFDTIGAGDSFNTGFLLSQLKGESLSTSLDAGCTTAANIISRFPRNEMKHGELTDQTSVLMTALTGKRMSA